MADMLMKTPIPFEAKRKNRWVVNIMGEDQLEAWFFTRTSRPSFKRRDFFSFMFSDKFKPEPMTLGLIDPIGPSSTEALMKIIREDKKLNWTIKLLDPVGVTVEEWKLTDCKILRVDFGSLDYHHDDLADIKMVMQPKRAVLEI